MKRTNYTLIAGALSLALLAGASTAAWADEPGESAKQDMKDSAHSAKKAATKTGHKVSHSVKKGVHKGAAKVDEGAKKVEDKTPSH